MDSDLLIERGLLIDTCFLMGTDFPPALAALLMLRSSSFLVAFQDGDCLGLSTFGLLEDGLGSSSLLLLGKDGTWSESSALLLDKDGTWSECSAALLMVTGNEGDCVSGQGAVFSRDNLADSLPKSININPVVSNVRN